MTVLDDSDDGVVVVACFVRHVGVCLYRTILLLLIVLIVNVVVVVVVVVDCSD